MVAETLLTAWWVGRLYALVNTRYVLTITLMRMVGGVSAGLRQHNHCGPREYPSKSLIPTPPPSPLSLMRALLTHIHFVLPYSPANRWLTVSLSLRRKRLGISKT